jgi:uncharacterized protein DUF3592
MPLSNLFRRKKADPEVERRTRLLQQGRITEGTIIDTGNDDSGAIRQVYFHYEVSGVEYESSQLLSAEQQEHANNYSPGARVTIRYDPHRPANSVVV